MKRTIPTAIRTAILLAITACVGLNVCAGDLDDGFRKPSEETKPWCYWYWLDGDLSKDGITKDLECMARVGIKLAMIGNIQNTRGKDDRVKVFSSQWYALTHHAFKEAHRLGVDLMMFNGPGWSQSGGPWVKPEQSMRRVTWAEFPAQGGAFSKTVRPGNVPAGQDIAVLAVPQPDAVSIVGTKHENALRFSHTEPFTARALIVHGKTRSKLYAIQDGQRKLVADIHANGGSKQTDFLPNAIETFSFNEATATQFELVPVANCKVVLTSEPRVAQVIEKQMGRLHPTPKPDWESYIFPDSVEPNDPSAVIKQKSIINLTDKLRADGVLNCTLPKGKWNVIYFGMVTTGKTNHPAAPEATGLEVDKMNKAHLEHHFNSMFNKLLKEMTPAERSVFKGVTIDSYEVGAQNWTDGFDAEFAKRYGYNPISFLPVLTGRVVDSAKTSDRFLGDLRRCISTLIAENYVGGLRDIAHKHNLKLWLENYGHWGFPGNFTEYGAYADMIGGEFWTRMPDRGPIECRAASSSAHIYGKQRVYVEAFTSSLQLSDHPHVLKPWGDRIFCEGVNHIVLHVVASQPRTGVPGINPWFGTAFHRNTPWFIQSRDWVTSLQRYHHMLQQGEPHADVAVYIGDFAPQMTGPANPVPAGYDYDYIGSDAILKRLRVVDGEWVVYDENDAKRISARWKLLAMPKLKYIRPQVVKRLESLKQQGGRVIDSVPVTAAALKSGGVAPVVSNATCPHRWKARRLDDGMIFFLSNFRNTGEFNVTLRVTGKAPELFNPVTGRITKLARYTNVDNGVRICIDVNDMADSVFIVFRSKQTQPSVAKVQSAGQGVSPADLKLFYSSSNKLMAETARPGTYQLTMSDGSQKSLSVKQKSQVIAINGPWKSTQKDKSGHTVLQEATFNLPSGFTKDRRVALDLGNVNVMAKVTLNGKTFDTLWMPPYSLDVTKTLKSGKNTLQVLVTSTSTSKPGFGKVQLKTMTRKEVNQ